MVRQCPPPLPCWVGTSAFLFPSLCARGAGRASPCPHVVPCLAAATSPSCRCDPLGQLANYLIRLELSAERSAVASAPGSGCGLSWACIPSPLSVTCSSPARLRFSLYSYAYALPRTALVRYVREASPPLLLARTTRTCRRTSDLHACVGPGYRPRRARPLLSSRDPDSPRPRRPARALLVRLLCPLGARGGWVQLVGEVRSADAPLAERPPLFSGARGPGARPPAPRSR